MATTFEVSDHHVLQFTRNVELLLQQKQPALLSAVTQASYNGEAAQKVLQFGEVEMEEFLDGTGAGQWKGSTVLGDIEHEQRWVFPVSYVKALPVSEEDVKRMLVSPQSPYAEAMRAAWARRIDKTIIDSALGNNTVGKWNDFLSLPFATSQVIAADGNGLTLDKLILTQQMLLESHADLAEGVYFIISPRQLSDLLKDEEKRITSVDYNNTKALMNGQPGSVLGFNFIISHHLPLEGGTTRRCVAWVKSGMHFGTWGNVKFRVSDRNDLNHLTQLHMSGTIGATRTQEKKLVRIDCTEVSAA